MSFESLPDEVLNDAPPWPLSRLFHEHSKLSSWRAIEFAEQISSFNTDIESLRRAASTTKEYPTMPEVELVKPSRWKRGRRLRDVLKTRRSRREPSSGRPITLAQLGELLLTAAGITNTFVHPEIPGLEQTLRAWPSGGGLYPIEIYPIVLRGEGIEPGVLHFDAKGNHLRRIAPIVDLSKCVFAEGLLDAASLLIVFTGTFARTQVKYGERGYRIVLLDAGHAAQNFLLVAEDLGLSSTPLGGFDDDRLAQVLGIDPTVEAPLHLVLISA